MAKITKTNNTIIKKITTKTRSLTNNKINNIPKTNTTTTIANTIINTIINFKINKKMDTTKINNTHMLSKSKKKNQSQFKMDIKK